MMDSAQISSPNWDEDCSNGYFDFNAIEDDELLQATCKVLETGKLTPIIKQELKCVIQSRRLADGKDELRIAFNSNSCNRRELSDLEKKKAEKRREQNRLSAQRFRKKKNERKIKINEEKEKLIKSNTILKLKIEELEKERNVVLHRLLQLLRINPGQNGAVPCDVTNNHLADAD